MGVTIHFEGKVKGATAYSLLIDELREFAARHFSGRIQFFFEGLKVEDEGEFWNTSDENILTEHIHRCNEVLKEMLAKNPG